MAEAPAAAPQGSVQNYASPSSSLPPSNALLAAIRSKNPTALQQALADGADKNTRSNGTPALTLCVQTGQTDLLRILITAGADVNQTDAQGISALEHARTRGAAEMVEILLKAGAK